MAIVHVVVFLLIFWGAIRLKMPVSLGLISPLPLHYSCFLDANFMVFAVVCEHRCAKVMYKNLP